MLVTFLLRLTLVTSSRVLLPTVAELVVTVGPTVVITPPGFELLRPREVVVVEVGGSLDDDTVEVVFGNEVPD